MLSKPLKFKNPRRPFTAARDEEGTAHIQADTWLAALYGLGVMHALDRPTQMLFARAVANGRSAELLADKQELIETDRFFRRAGLHRNLAREVKLLDDDTFRQLTAYCEGVNDGLKQSRRSLPMRATGFYPTPWTQESVLLIGNLLSYAGLVVMQLQSERLIIELVKAGVDRQRLRELFEPHLDGADFDLLAQINTPSRLSDEALELLTDLPRLAGSNAWVVAPHRSATGGALLANDPHLEVNRLPPIWYEAVLRWGDNYAMGATLPGCPLLGVGRTNRIAWGVTYMKGDTADYFIEDCRPGDTGWQYRRGDQWHDFAVREETILRKSGQSETVRIYENALGTLEADPQSSGAGLYLLSAWTGHGEEAGRSMGVWLRMVHQQSVRDAMSIARENPQPTLNWLLADVDGHIGYQANGWFPRRPEGHSGLLPIPAWEQSNHWNGLVPLDELPSAYDPPEGFISSANESVNQPGRQPLVTQPVPDYRKRRIDEVLRRTPLATVDDMQALQYDVVSMQARDLLPVFLPHLPEGPIKERLARWDFAYDADSEEATLFTRLYRNVLLEIAGREGQEGGFGWRRMLYLISRIGFSLMVVTCADRLLKRDDSIWWRGRDKGELIRKAAERMAGEEVLPWRVTNSFVFTNRFIENGFVGRTLGLHTSELPMPGCHATPFQGHLLRSATRETTFAPSYHFVTDMSRDEAWTNLPGGPSESWLSRWYKIGIQHWLSGTYRKLTPDRQ